MDSLYSHHGRVRVARHPDVSICAFPVFPQGSYPMKTAVAAIALMLAGCTTFNRPPTLTQVTDGALKCYSTAFKSGAVSSDLAVKVSVEYLNYRQAARIARDAKTNDS